MRNITFHCCARTWGNSCRDTLYAAFQHACVYAEHSLNGLDPLIASLKQKVLPPFSLHMRYVRHSHDFMTFMSLSMHAYLYVFVQIRKVDSEILLAVRQQSSSGSRAR
jgi:hypothetical protein